MKSASSTEECHCLTCSRSLNQKRGDPGCLWGRLKPEPEERDDFNHEIDPRSGYQSRDKPR